MYIQKITIILVYMGNLKRGPCGHRDYNSDAQRENRSPGRGSDCLISTESQPGSKNVGVLVQLIITNKVLCVPQKTSESMTILTTKK